MLTRLFCVKTKIDDGAIKSFCVLLNNDNRGAAIIDAKETGAREICTIFQKSRSCDS